MRKHFWVTNICNRNITLHDLNVTIKAYSSVNLLDKKHYNYSINDLEISLTKGCLFKKRKILFLRKNPPDIIKANVTLLSETYIPSRERSAISIKEQKYEELSMSDEEFITETSDTI